MCIGIYGNNKDYTQNLKGYPKIQEIFSKCFL